MPELKIRGKIYHLPPYIFTAWVLSTCRPYPLHISYTDWNHNYIYLDTKRIRNAVVQQRAVVWTATTGMRHVVCLACSLPSGAGDCQEQLTDPPASNSSHTTDCAWPPLLPNTTSAAPTPAQFCNQFTWQFSWRFSSITKFTEKYIPS